MLFVFALNVSIFRVVKLDTIRKKKKSTFRHAGASKAKTAPGSGKLPSTTDKNNNEADKS